MKKLHILLGLTLPLGLNADLLLYDSFSSAPGEIPAGWTAVEGSTSNQSYIDAFRNDFVTEGSLNIDGLAPSEGNKWTLDNSPYQSYYRNFSDTPLQVGDTIFFSFALRIDDLGALEGGHTSQMILLNAESSTTISTGKSGISFRRDPDDASKYNIAVDGEFRGPNDSQGRGVILPEQYALGEVVFIVGAYTYGANNAETFSQFWINPDAATFGNLTAPDPTISDPAGNRTANIQSLLIATGTSPNQHPALWNIDELRIGTTWGSVTPIPEPSTYALLFGAGVMSLAILRRHK